MSAIVKKIKKKKKKNLSAPASEVEGDTAAKMERRAKKAAAKAASSVVTASAPELADATAGRAFLERHEIIIHADDAPPPCTALASAPFPLPVLELLSQFTEPSAVQGASWPLAVAGRDVLAIAKTGSGKTLAFLLPAIVRCAAERKSHPEVLSPPAPFCVVMAPTRELVLQTTQQGQLFGAPLGVRTVAVYGGSPKWGQVKDVQAGCEIVVATPGRMLDMLDLASASGFGTGGKRSREDEGAEGGGGDASDGSDGGKGGGGKGGGGKGGGGKGGKGKGKGKGKGGGKGGGGSYSGYSSGDGPCLSLSLCRLLVLDEADRMLDMGFERDCHMIAAQVAIPRQVLLFTATWPQGVQRVAAAMLRPDHVRVTVGAVGEKLMANASVRQHVRIVDAKDKWSAFLEMVSTIRPAQGAPKLSKTEKQRIKLGWAAAPDGAADTGAAVAAERVLIFCNTRRDVNGIGAYLAGAGGLVTDTISGDRTQNEREGVIRAFREGSISVVVATDVAARGLDISGIDRVINYDFPMGEGGAEEYVHRIGRTARAGASGTAETLFTLADSRHAAALATLLRDAGQAVPEGLEELATTKRPRSHHGGRGVKAKQEKAEELAEELAMQKVVDGKKARAQEFRAKAELQAGE